MLITQGNSSTCLSPQQVVSELMVVWGKGGKVNKVPFVVRAGTGCVYLKPFLKWSRTSPFHSWSGDGILHQASP